VRSFEVLFKKKTSPTKNLRVILNFFLPPTISFTLILLHILFPQLIDASMAILLALFGIGLSAWVGGYKTGIAASIFLACGLGVTTLYLGSIHTSAYLFAIITRSILLIVEGALLSILIDLGKRQEHIAKYRHQARETKKQIEILTITNESLKKEIKLRDEFLSIASHELKTPLTSMLLQTQTALHNIRNVSLAHFSIESLLKMLESVEHQTKRLSKIISELFNISIMTTGNLVLERENCDLGKIVQGVLNDFETRFDREGYQVMFKAQKSIIGFWDKIRIEQAASNLISNAIKYGEKKPIEVTVKRHGNTAEILIEDHGIGISKKKQKDIFGLFERGVSSEDYKGLGVGLYITEQIIRAHKGTIHVSSKENGGTKFIVKLPITREQKS
jgi:signal transduction histidine kinase